MRRYESVVSLLLDRRANPALKNKNGHSALTLAMENYDSQPEPIVEAVIQYIDKLGFQYREPSLKEYWIKE
jgi:ankyrin repeat protein